MSGPEHKSRTHTDHSGFLPIRFILGLNKKGKLRESEKATGKRKHSEAAQMKVKEEHKTRPQSKLTL